MSMALKYGMNKRKKMADGGPIKSPNGEEIDDYGTADPIVMAAKGGLVDRCMTKRMAKGGSVAPEGADLSEDDFDILDEVDDLDSSYTGADSGDELGDKIPDESLDLVSRAMRKRAKS